MEQPHHLLQLLGRRLLTDCVGSHHVAPQRAVADEEGRVDAEPAVEAGEIVAEALPLPVDALLERGERHPFDLRHHPAQVVGITGSAGGEREAAVAADDGGDAVHVRRRRGRVPEQLRVVVRVGIDDAGDHEQAVGVDDRGRLLVAAPTITTRPSDPTSASRAGAPVPSTTVPPRINRSSTVVSLS